MPRLLKLGVRSKCIWCRDIVEGGRVVDAARRLVVCDTCRPKCIWNSSKRYFKSRYNNSRWEHEKVLLNTIVEVLHLKDNEVMTEVGFPDWGLSIRGGLVRYDIGIYKYRLLVDYHGEGHYRFIKDYHHDAEGFRVQLANDGLKPKYANQNGWNYMIFNYTEDIGDKEWVRRRLVPLV